MIALHYISFIVVLFLITGCSSNPKINKNTEGTYAIYGNWCGPDHPKYSKGPSPAPIDVLDAACMRHDQCYDIKGYLSCQCDEILRYEINRDIKSHQYDKEQKLYADAIRAHFSVSPCDGDGEGKVGPSKILHKVYNGAKKQVTTFVNGVMGESNKDEKTQILNDETSTNSKVDAVK